MSLRALVLLDRDGVINVDRSDYVKSIDEWVPITGSLQAIRDIYGKYDVAICTNQSAISRGIVSKSEVDAIHQEMANLVDLPMGKSIPIYVCPHQPVDNCSCRKPKTGLLDSAIVDLRGDRSTTYFVGDSLTDVRAAMEAGCIPILVRTGRGAETEQLIGDSQEVRVFDDLRSFSNALLRQWLKI
jgi:D-glycero-D-manno-heptose 1,7-bisphosphate phosphatase